MPYTTKQLFTAFGVSHQTIKNWAKEFAAFLSPTATPMENHKRIYTDEDVRVLELVNRLKKEGQTYESIKAALGAGQRGELPDIPRAIEPLKQTAQLAMALQRVQALEVELELLRGERDRRLEAEGQVKLLERYLENTQTKLDEANKQITQLRMKLFGDE